MVVALIAANVPFLSEKWMTVIPLRSPKGFAARLFELLLFYGLVGGFAVFLEHRAGQISPQGWEFYAITLTVFLTLAFPGFVYRYLLKRSTAE